MLEDNSAIMWLKIKSGKIKFTFVGCYYRQSRLPVEMGILNTGTKESQKARFNKFTNRVKAIWPSGGHMVILGDININISVDK